VDSLVKVRVKTATQNKFIRIGGNKNKIRSDIFYIIIRSYVIRTTLSLVYRKIHNWPRIRDESWICERMNHQTSTCTLLYSILLALVLVVLVLLYSGSSTDSLGPSYYDDNVRHFCSNDILLVLSERMSHAAAAAAGSSLTRLIVRAWRQQHTPL
jgi:hypothetical protein